MSWDADLIVTDVDGNETCFGDWNFTHNLNPAINEALGNPEVSTYWAKQFGGCWWEVFNGKTGKETKDAFQVILDAFAADPEKYKAMEPDNGWGRIEHLVPVLEQMRDACEKHPSAVWKITG